MKLSFLEFMESEQRLSIFVTYKTCLFYLNLTYYFLSFPFLISTQGFSEQQLARMKKSEALTAEREREILQVGNLHGTFLIIFH